MIMETTLFFDRQKNICNFLEWLRFSQQYPTLISNEISFIGRERFKTQCQSNLALSNLSIFLYGRTSLFQTKVNNIID